MAFKNKKELELETPADPVAESRELEKDQAGSEILPGEFVVANEEEEHIIFTRENLILIAPKVWHYNHDEDSLGALSKKHAFRGQLARDFGIREGDTVICMPLKGEGKLIKVPQNDK